MSERFYEVNLDMDQLPNYTLLFLVSAGARPSSGPIAESPAHSTMPRRRAVVEQGDCRTTSPAEYSLGTSSSPTANLVASSSSLKTC